MAGTGSLVYAGDFIDKKEFFFLAQGWKNATASHSDYQGFRRLTATGPTFSSYAYYTSSQNISYHYPPAASAVESLSNVATITFTQNCLLELIFTVKAASDSEYRININLYVYRNGQTFHLGGCDDNAAVAPRVYQTTFQFLAGDILYAGEWNSSNPIVGVRTTVAYIING